MKKFLTLVAIIITVFVVTKCSDQAVIDETQNAVTIPEVTTQTVGELMETSSKISIVGRVEASKQFEIKAKTSGEVASVNVSEGQAVSTDKVLVELDHNSADASVMQAQGALTSASANLQKLINGSRSEDVQILELQLEAALNQKAILTKGAREEEVEITQTSLANTRSSLEDAREVLRNTEEKAIQDKKTVGNNSLYAIQSAAITAGRVMTFYLQDIIIEGSTPADCRYDFITSYSTQFGVSCVEAFNAMYDLQELAESLHVNSTQIDYEYELTLAESYLEVIQNYLEPTFLAVEGAIGTTSNQSFSGAERANLKNQILSARSELEATLNQVSNQKQALKTQELNTQLSLTNARSSVNELENRVVSLEKELQIKTTGARSEEIAIQDAQIKQLQLQLAMAKNGARPEDVAAQRGVVESARAQLKSAVELREQSLIRAPYSGKVISLNVKAGETINPNQVIGFFADDSSIEISAYVSEEEASFIKVGDSAVIHGPHGYIDSNIASIASYLDPITNKIKVTIIPEKPLTIGAVVKIELSATKNTTQVPLTAVKFKGESAYILVVNSDNILEEREVVTGDILGNSVSIENNLNANEQVVIDSRQVSFDDQPILTISLAADLNERALKDLAQDVADRIERVNGVSEVTVIGAYDREAHVIVSQAKLQQYGISLNAVSEALSSQNANLPGGTIENNGNRFSVNFNGDIEGVEELLYIPVIVSNGAPVYIKDIAEVKDTTAKPATLSKLSINGEPAKSALSLNIKKKVGGDILKTTDNIKSIINELSDTTLSDVTVYYSLEMAEYIREDLSRLIVSGLQTIVFVTVLLIFVLGFRAAVLAGLSIPLSFLIAIAGLSYIGSTINFLSLFSLILALGILVDSAIVLTEGIVKRMEDGLEPFDAAKKTVDQFKTPITSGVLTTIAAMVPMLFASGIIGEFIKHIPITVSLVLIASLFVSLAFLPALGAKFLKVRKVKEDSDKKQVLDLNKYGEKYREYLEGFLKSRSRKVLLSVLLVIGFIGALALPITGILKVAMFPSADSELLFIDMELPQGSTLETTDRFSQKIENELRNDPNVDSFVVNLGQPFVTDIAAAVGGQTTHLGYIIVTLKDDKEISSLEIADKYTEDFSKFKEGTILITQEESGPPSGAPVALKFQGDDLKELERLALKGKEILTTIDGTESVRSSVQESGVTFSAEYKRGVSGLFGVTPMQVGRFIRTAINGVPATSIKKQDENIDVIVKLNLTGDPTLDPHKANEVTINSLRSLQIDTINGLTPLESLVDFKLEGAKSTIQHEDGKRTVQTTSYVGKGYVPSQIISELEKRLDELNMTEDVTLSYGGESEDISESFADMFRAMFIGIFLIAGILVLQFNSFKQPIFVLMTVPLAIIGILPGLAVMGLPFSFTAFIGMVALSGIVVNNAILLIDRINENRHNGFTKIEAILESASARFRPIILTTVTTVAGIAPLALSDVTWGPLGFSIIFGLAFSTILTLLVVPMLYLKFAEETL